MTGNPERSILHEVLVTTCVAGILLLVLLFGLAQANDTGFVYVNF